MIKGIIIDGKIAGDDANVASRIQSIASGNCIPFSDEIQHKIKNIAKFRSVSLRPFDFKNVEKLMIVFALANKGLIIPNPNIMEGKLKRKKEFAGGSISYSPVHKDYYRNAGDIFERMNGAKIFIYD